MKRTLLVSAMVLVLCSAILFNVFADSNTPQLAIEPQDICTSAQLDGYVESINNINRTIVRQMESEDLMSVTITFSKYISFDELQEFVEEYNVELQQIQLRGFMEDGTRVSMSTLAHMGINFTENHAYAEAEKLSFQLVGITDVYAFVSPDMLNVISDNGLVYLVDASSNVTSERVGTVDMNQADKTAAKPAFPKSITWELENLGMLK